MKIKMTNKGLDMSLKDEHQDRCRSLVCDPNGIIVAEMVYRCMICFYVSDTMSEARQHYVLKHIEEDDLSNDNCADQIDDLDDLKNIPKLNKKLQQQNNNSKFQNNKHLNHNEIDNFTLNGSKYRDNSSGAIDMSPSSDSYDRYMPSVVTISEGIESNTNLLQNGGKSGYVNCAVCKITRFYSCVQRRYGQFTCVTCYRYFKQFFDKPERFSCPNLGKCSLNVRTRCRACWMKACIDVFQVDGEKQQLIDAFAPIKQINTSVNNSEDEHIDTLEGLDSSSPIDDKMDNSDDNNNSINGHLNQSKEALSMMLALNNSTDLPTLLSKSNLNGFSLLGSNANLFGNLNDNNNNSLINHGNTNFTNSLTNQNVQLNGLNGTNNNLANNLSSNNLQSFLTPKRGNHLNSKNLNGQLNINNLNANLNTDTIKGNDANEKDSNNNKPAKTKTSSGKKVWSCGKCITCIAEDCGKCIYCLDRPKFGGPFVKKQRCLRRRCLMKIKDKQNKKLSQQQAQNKTPNTSAFATVF